MGNYNTKQKSKGIQYHKENEDTDVFLKLICGGDKEVEDKVIESFSKDPNFLEKVWKRLQENGKKAKTANDAFDVLQGVAFVLDIAKPITDALQIAGIAFVLVLKALELAQGFKEVDELAKQFYQELEAIKDSFQKLQNVQQTTRMQIDEDSKQSVNDICTAILNGYNFLKFIDPKKVEKFFHQAENKSKVRELHKALQLSRAKLTSNLIIYILDESPKILAQITDIVVREEIWKSFQPIAYEQPIEEVVEKIGIFFKRNFPNPKSNWEHIKERLAKDLDTNGDKIVHLQEINMFTVTGLKKALEKYAMDPSFSQSKNILEARQELGRYLNLCEGIGKNKRETSEQWYPGTRESLLNNVKKWLREGRNTVFCVKGSGGMGKSVLSYKVITDHKDLCIGYFFFDYSEKLRTSLSVAVKSILLQIAERFPEARIYLADQLKEEFMRKSLLDSLDNLLEQLLDGVLKEIPKSDASGNSYFLLFDALDEMHEDYRNDLITFLEKLERKNLQIKVIVTTRPDAEITTKLANYKVKMESIDKESEQNKQDIRLYAKSIAEGLSAKLQKASKVDLENTLVLKSEGVFLWMRFAKDLLTGMHRISTQDIENLPLGLERQYMEYFKRLFKSRDKEELFKIIKLLVLSFEPLNFVQISWLLGKNFSTPKERFRFQSLLDSLQSIFPLNYQGYYYPIHKTVSDFVKSQKESFFLHDCDLEECFTESKTHREISSILIAQLFKDTNSSFFLPKFREIIYEINTIYPLSEEQQRILLEKWRSHFPVNTTDTYLCFLYAIKFLLYHLKGADQSNESAKKEDQKMWTNILEYLYVKYSLHLSDLIADSQAIQSVFNQDVLTWLRQYHHIFTETPFAIFQYACVHEPVRDLALTWAKEFNQTHHDKVAWINLPPLNTSCIQTLVGHTFFVTCCAISSDDKWIVSGSYDTTLKIWDSLTGELKKTLSGHTKVVTCCAITPDGTWIASGSEDGTLRIWNSSTGELKHTFSGHSTTVTCCAISSDSNWIVSGSNDKTLKLWNSYGGVKYTFSGHTGYITCCALSVDGMSIISGSSDQTLSIWSAVTGKLKRTLSGHTKTVSCCAISSDNTWIVSGSYDATLRIWNSATGELKSILQHTYDITCCSISLDGALIVSGSFDKTLSLWNSSTGELKSTLSEHNASISGCAISTKGNWLVSSSYDNTLRIWSSFSSKELKHTFSGHSTTVTSCAVSPDGNWMVSGSEDKTLKLWNSVTGELKHTLSGDNTVTCCAVSPNGSWIVIGEEVVIKIWNSSKNELKYFNEHNYDPVSCCAIPSSGAWFVSGHSDDKLRIWDLFTGELKAIFNGHTKAVSCCAISPDDTWIVSGSYDETLKIWNSATGELKNTLVGHIYDVTRCAITADGACIMSGSSDKTFKLWNSSSGELLFVLDSLVIDITINSKFCFAVSDSVIYELDTTNPKNPIDRKYYFFGNKRSSMKSNVLCVFQHNAGIHFPVFTKLDELEMKDTNISSSKLLHYKDVTDRLEALIKLGKDDLVDLSHEEFMEAFIFNNRLRQALVPIWNTFASVFVGKSIFQIEIDQINNTPVSPGERFTMFMHKLQNSSEGVKIVEVIDAFKKTDY